MHPWGMGASTCPECFMAVGGGGQKLMGHVLYHTRAEIPQVSEANRRPESKKPS